jgi:hypothetical protein
VSLAYQPLDQALLLFGGKTEAGASAETWIYDLRGNLWMQREGGESPAARSNQATAGDAATGQAIISGGLGDEVSGVDVWEWMP